VTVPQRQPVNPDALKKLEKLSDQLDTAEDASEATTKDVQLARRTADHLKRDMRLQTRASSTRSKDRSTKDGKSKAAVELGRKGGVARAKTLTRQQRSTLAVKAAKSRWSKR
jgi:hypothetical protein